MSENSLPEPIAIVGMACRLPGADNVDQFWKLIHAGDNAITPLPPDRLNRELYFDPQRGQICKTYSDLGGLVKYRPFDQQACPIPDEVIEQVDVAHLTLLEVAAEACRDAGYDPFKLANRKMGVFIGHTGGSPLVSDYLYSTVVEEGALALDRVAELSQLGLDVGAVRREVVNQVRRRYPGRQPKQKLRLGALVGAELISEAFNLDGACGVVDAACASSLQALSLGVRALLQGRMDATLVGSASYCKSDSLVLFSAAQSVSSQGSCPFSREADGLITAEGYVVFMLKTLSRALQDGDRIQALISGIGVSTDGRGKSLWAPRADGQILAVERAYAGEMDANRLQYIEAHATSTQVGDATELQALSRSLSNMLRDPNKKIPIGSVKGNVGHTLETAGVAGLLKTVLAIKRQIIPPAVKFRELNTEIDWNSSPFYVPFEPQAWPEFADGHPRRAAVNSFGIGGLNVHLVVDEFKPVGTAVTRSHGSPKAASVGSSEPRTAATAEPIAIIGMGCIFPGAHTVDAFWNMLASGQDLKSIAPPDRIPHEFRTTGQAEPWRTYNLLGGFVEGWEYDWRRHKIPPKQIAQANPLQFMLLDAADQAFQDAGIDLKSMQGLHASVIVGTVFGGDFSDQLQMGLRLPEFRATLRSVLSQRGVPVEKIAAIEEGFQKQLLAMMPALLDETGSFTSSTLASRITKSFNLMGGALALDAGNNSAALVIQAAVDQLRLGHADMVVCAAGQRSMDLWTYEGLSLADTLAHDQPKSGLNSETNGVLPGEGCGVILLKRLQDAQRDGNPIRGVIRGVASSAHKDPRRAVEQAGAAALAEAGLPSSAVMAIETCAIRDEDQQPAELRGLVSTYAGDDRAVPVTLSDVTTQIGHTGGASAMAAIIKTTLASQKGELPATLNVDTPHTEIAQGKAEAATRLTKIPTVPDSRYRACAVSSLHSQIAYQIILDNGAPLPTFATVSASSTTAAETNTTLRIARFAAEHGVALRELLAQAQQDSAKTWQTATETRFASQAARCAILAASPDELRKKLALAAEAVGRNRHDIAGDQGIFFATEATPPAVVAALFPGQGSQYIGMTKGWCESDPAALLDRKQADEIMQRHGLATYSQLAWEADSPLGKEVWSTQAALLLADWLSWGVVRRLGLRADFVAGHSYGEFPALVAAGAWTLEEAVLATRARCEAVVACQQGETMMLSLTANRELVESVLRESGRRVWLCAENGPEQCVVGGELAEVQAIAEIFSQRRIRSKALAVPCAFHTPLLDASRAPLAAALRQRHLQSPQVPFASTTFPCFLSQPVDLRASLVAQMTHPVEFVATIQRLVEAGANTFIEIGPSQVLTQLTQRIVPDVENYRTLSLDVPARLEQLPALRLQAACEAWGISLDNGATKATTAALGFVRQVQPTIAAPIQLIDATQRRRQRLRDKAAGRGRKSDAMRTEVAATATSTPTTSAPAAPVAKPALRMDDATARLVIDVMSVHRATANSRTGADATWADQVRDANHFLDDLCECFSLDDQQLRQVRATPTLGGMVEFLRDCPGKADWLENRHRATAPTVTTPTTEPSLDLERYLIDFVVDQTGYPPEIVELDADLEADLGIDSIKKAQLFGEVGERFQLSADPDLSLDDFPTLGHVLGYLRQHVKGAPAPSLSTASSAHAPYEGNGAATAVLERVAVQPRAHASPPRDVENELESFLIDFVVEQTGYPAEIVELDADLEADLGIDSIKKAQLFGEIGNRFQLSADPDLSLDDFPTLRHVMAYLLKQPSVAGDSIAPSTSTSDDAWEQNGDAHTLATAPRAAVAVVDSRETSDLEPFLVNFVVEQTGYPPEIVELDADLEADLGIDSIKKAQLFGEIGNHFRLEADPDLSLDDFPTLRHVLNYLVRHLGKGMATTSSDLKQNTNSAAAYDRGFVHGRQHREAIGSLLRRQAAEPNATMIPASQWLAELTADEREELQGIAAGAEVLFENLVAWQCHLDNAQIPYAARLEAITVAGTAGATISCDAEITAKLCVDMDAESLLVRVPGQLGAVAGLNRHGAMLTIATLSEPASKFQSAIRLRRLLATSTGPGPAALNSATSLSQLQKQLENEAPVASRSHRSTRLDALATCHGIQLIVVGPTAWVRHYNNAQLNNGSAPWKSLSLPFVLPSTTSAPPPASAPPVALPSRELPPLSFPAGPRVTQRFLPRLVAASPQVEAAIAALPRSVILIGDATHAPLLASRLQSRGLKVERLSQRLSAEEIERQLTSKLATLPEASLILALELPVAKSREQRSWHKSAQELLLNTFRACQLWTQQPSTSAPRTLLASVSLGGSFGLTSGVISPWSGGLCGLLKGIRNEFPELVVRVVDLAADLDAQQAGTALATEFLGQDRETEIAWNAQGRWCVRYEQADVTDQTCPVPSSAGEQWIVTGGARGITGAVAKALAERYGIKLHLLGTTALENVEPRWLTATADELKQLRGQVMIAAKKSGSDPLRAWSKIEKTIEVQRQLAALQAAAIDAAYHVCDLGDWKALDNLLTSIRQQGPIRGILHGAGYEAAAKFEKKKLALVERTIVAKAGGAAALLALTESDPIGWFIGFGSTSGRLGGIGQTDYSLANDMLAKQVDWLRNERPTCRAAVFHWHAWDEIGMAARPESRFALESFGLRFMPPSEGIAYLLAELEAGLPEPEVMITETLLCPAQLQIVKKPIAPRIDESPAVQQSSNAVSTPDWESYLVNFVVEQTGYPPEIVELDADLEADLGIDSIKKAQLFGEIGNQFSLQADPNLSLDDFPTLRHVLGYLERTVGVSTSTASPAAATDEVASSSSTVVTPSNLDCLPLIAEVKSSASGGYIAQGTLDPTRDPFLTDHRMLGRPVLPGVTGCELLAQAVAARTPRGRYTCWKNVLVTASMRFPSDEVRPFEVHVERGPACESGTAMVASLRTLLGERRKGESDPRREHVRGEVSFPDQLTITLPTLEQPPFPYNPMVYPDHAAMYHGPLLRTLDGLMFQHGGGWGRLKSATVDSLSGSRAQTGWISPMALIDGCIVGCAVYSWLMRGGRVEIPQGFGEMWSLREPVAEESLQMQFQFLRADERNSWFDFALFAADGQPIVVCRDLRLVRFPKDDAK